MMAIDQKGMRVFFKYFNRFMLIMWRLGLDRWLSFWPSGFGQFMVINHTGRKSGELRKTPVNFAEVEGEIYCVAGAGRTSDWYQNMLANPNVEIWLPYSRWSGNAEVIPLAREVLPILREVLRCSGFAGRLAGIYPGLSDDDLLSVCNDYGLVHIIRQQPRTGKGGPGDLAWVWSLAVMLMLPMICCKKRK
jgi:deazaflavin-dependent oxidoreductase (nitroreductase family)